MTQRNQDGRFTNEVQVTAWLYDSASANTNARMNLRYHREGWCSTDQPYGTSVAFVREVEGNPNDFECCHCGLHFRRVVVSKDVAAQIKQVTADNFNGANAPEAVDELPVTTRLIGCDCVTGYEHTQREAHSAPVVGSVPEGQEVVPMLFGTFSVTMARKDADNAAAPPNLDQSTEPARGFIERDYVNPWALGGDLA